MFQRWTIDRPALRVLPQPGERLSAWPGVPRVPRWLGLSIIVALLLTGCGSSGGNASTKPSASFARLVDIGAGRKVYLECRGSGSPTVVFISGRSNRADIWSQVTDASGNLKGSSSAVYPRVSRLTRVCAYDRPGTVTIDGRIKGSRSSPVSQPTTAADGVRDLHALLTAAKVPGPYVLVAHSWGGMIARLYTARYPNAVSGLVLVDVLTELLMDNLTPQQRALWIRVSSIYSPDLNPYHQEKTSFAPSFQSLRTATQPRRMPVVMLTSDQPYNQKAIAGTGVPVPGNFAAIVYGAHVAGQKMLAQRLGAKLILNTHASHYVQTEQPRLVINSTRYVVDRVRKVSDPPGLSFTPQPNPSLESKPAEDNVDG